jgi:hypothetical protein
MRNEVLFFVLGPTPTPIEWSTRALYPGVKRPEREADHSPPTSAKFKNTSIYTSTPPYAFMAQCLIKHRDNFTLALLIRTTVDFILLKISSIKQSWKFVMGLLFDPEDVGNMFIRNVL